MSLTPDKADDLRAPLLMLVSGAPASGKSTLARHLSTVLSLPLLARDAFTEILADAFAVQSTAQRATIVQPTHTIYYAVLDQLLAAGVSVIAESNFQRGISERALALCLAHAQAVLIHCETSRALSFERFKRRYERGERHRVYFDGERIASIEAGEPQEAWERAEPLDIGVPVLRVDTTSGWRPDSEHIVAFVRSAHDPRKDR